MDKKTIIIIATSILLIIIIGLGIGGYIYLKKSKARGFNTAEDITNSATKGVLPSLETNPLENKPDVNPASAANPLKDIKINPF